MGTSSPMSLRTSPQKKPIDAPTKMQQTWLEKEHAQSVLLPGVLRHVGQRRGERYRWMQTCGCLLLQQAHRELC